MMAWQPMPNAQAAKPRYVLRKKDSKDYLTASFTARATYSRSWPMPSLEWPFLSMPAWRSLAAGSILRPHGTNPAASSEYSTTMKVT